MRSRIALQVDGGLKTGRDVIIGALLGADEFGFSTAPLIASGCLMMRKCHLNTCPVGIATQDPVLRKRFRGQPEHVVNFFFFVAEEVRQIMAAMGFRKFEDMIGESQLLAKTGMIDHWKAKGLDFSGIFYKPDAERSQIHWTQRQNHPIDDVLDRKLIAKAMPALETGEPVRIEMPITQRRPLRRRHAVGRGREAHGHSGLPDDTIAVAFTGTAGQSFGAFLARGVSFDLQGEGNDYVGKGLSGGRIVVRPPENSRVEASKSIIVGNTVHVRRYRRRVLFQRRRGRAFRCAQFGRHRGCRGRRRPWLRIHDRRHRGDHRRDRAQLRGRHVGRHRLCAG